MMKLKSKLFYSYLLFVVIYGGFVLLPAPAPATLLLYHVSAMGLRLIDLTIIVLLAAIWFAGFYGFAQLQAYSQLIQNDKDGKQLAKLTNGIFLLVMWLPVSSVTSSVLNYIVTKHTGLLPAVKIIENYISLCLPLLGFILIGRAARGLGKLVRHRFSYNYINFLAVILIYVGLIYYRLIVTTSDRQAIYHMSIWLILLTLVAPYIYMWFVGLMAVYDIYGYGQKIKGIVYKKAWGLLALGLGWLIVLSISFQYLTSLSARLSHLSIYWILAIIYALLLVLSVGFVLTALGARRLRRIEEV
jgi:hypothetical protein